MELKEYFSIIKKQFKLFLSVIIAVVASIFIYFIFRPVFFDTSLFLNITRAGNQISEGYKYDNFYRLQADEKFAETIAQWLKSPRVVSDINKEAEITNMENLNLKQLTKVFQADKLSAQIVSVKFSAPDKKTAEKLALAIPVILKKNINQLNEDQKENTWFEIKANDPVIRQNNPDWGIIFIISLVLGLFLGFWVVLFRHYWQ
jgi:capsular polysaccharide biosynthesis protein